ncbi:ABC transporter ATP-binding protein/permease [Acetatifactor muris]|uniref:Heterocyst differentiation ATP-binding protein HepA n=1 Tax=Acetatifactor muris TaxID=879566 RepID=A0A2K4ZFD7_9FIRM|nr:ABC transporter ATP-binding protein [Acetatifactor muris]MCR2047367.1 ABC transporter ATP-binding protein/permease [Acetatifactor muris]SOY29172.1 Heterocyst differentiation ATP-binding protein HepA [Acetatifactor muris]
MLEILKKLRLLLDGKQKRAMGGLVVMMIIGAFLQTAGVGLLVQVVSVVIDPQAMEKSALVRAFYDFLGCRDFQQFSVTVMVLLIVVFVVKNLFLFLQQKLMLAFVYTNQFRTSERMMRNYLRRGYEFFLNADTAVVQRSITSDVNNMYALILALLQLFSDGVMTLFVAGYCLMSNGIMTILLAVVLLILMVLIKKVLEPVVYRAGEDNRNYYSSLFKWISQTVQGIKEVKIHCREQYFVDEYCKCGRGYVSAVQRYSLYNNMPKLFIETACIAVMVGYMIALTAAGTSTENMLEMLSTLGAAAFVLLPAVNRINNQILAITYCKPPFMGVSDNLQEEIRDNKVDMSFAADVEEKLPLERAVELRDIVYAYPNTDRLIFDHADLTIPKGSSVGIVGTSGAGKSTIVDILLGLLEVKSGRIYADGREVKTEYRRFLKNIGYIPQMIFMLDDTIRRNVAFGVPEEKIDEARVWEVLREARLDEFVRTLPEGLDTGIGERGIRLSGGQRQRIGIARALYHDPEILILDEATSALDNDTEAAIMESINRLHGRKTLVIIAHRLQTIEKCDLVYRVEDGKAVIERGQLNKEA